MVAFNFIVQEPRGIMVRSNAKSRSARLRKYLNIAVSEWYELKIGCSRNPLLRAKLFVTWAIASFFNETLRIEAITSKSCAVKVSSKVKPITD